MYYLGTLRYAYEKLKKSHISIRKLILQVLGLSKHSKKRSSMVSEIWGCAEGAQDTKQCHKSVGCSAQKTVKPLHTSWLVIGYATAVPTDNSLSNVDCGLAVTADSTFKSMLVGTISQPKVVHSAHTNWRQSADFYITHTIEVFLIIIIYYSIKTKQFE